MSMPTLIIDNPNFDPDIAPSFESTEWRLKDVPPAPARRIRIRNTVKRGIPMSYWTCVDIPHDGIYDLDVRALPGVTDAQAEEHAKAFEPATQRTKAIELLRSSLPQFSALKDWLHAQAEVSDGQVTLLEKHGATKKARSRPVPTAIRLQDAAHGGAAEIAKAVQAMRRRLDRWELEHLRKHATELFDRLCVAENRIEDLESEVSRAWHTAESWQQDAERLVRDLEAAGKSIGLTQSGALVVVDEDDGMPF